MTKITAIVPYLNYRVYTQANDDDDDNTTEKTFNIIYTYYVQMYIMVIYAAR